MIKNLPKIKLKIEDIEYFLYVASSQEEKLKGLSGVRNLGPREGMIFSYDHEAPRSFQFKETLIPLKIYFVNKKGKIVKKEKTKPGQNQNVACSTPCKWVIEIFDGGD